MSNNYRYRKYVGEKDFSNRFATPEEIESLLNEVDLTKDELPLNSGGAAFISDTKTAYVDKGDYHTLILGATGSMKTRLFILPTVYTLGLAGENMVITDPKGEIYEKTSGFLEKKGYDVKVLNLRDMNHSDCWNPLEESYHLYHSGKKEEGLRLAKEFVTVLLNRPMRISRDIFWPMSAKQFLQGVVEILVRGAPSVDEANIASALSFFSYTKDENGDNKHTPLRSFCEKLPPENPIKQNLEAAIANAPVTMAGILGQASSSLGPFSISKSLQKLSSSSTIDIHCFKDVEKKHAIFVIVPDEVTTYHFFVSSFIKQIYSAAINDAQSFPDGALPRRLNFLLDEFANIPEIPEMSTMITAARSRNVRFYLVVQSDNQLKSNYGEEGETIKTNCLVWVYLTSKEVPLIKQVQLLTGDSNRSKNSKPLITEYELSTLKKVFGKDGGAEAIVLISRSRAYKTFLPDISRYEQFVAYPPKVLPVTDGGISFFDVEGLCTNLDEAEILKIYTDAYSGNDVSLFVKSFK
ncbi:MAG: type IV secretory system conjugative DNA transfer family protein [Bacilli bacterium]|nr:type IV secretory system conjugative DNA transfer family protein [Bacilli bacterium]